MNKKKSCIVIVVGSVSKKEKSQIEVEKVFLISNLRKKTVQLIEMFKLTNSMLLKLLYGMCDIMSTKVK